MSQVVNVLTRQRVNDILCDAVTVFEFMEALCFLLSHFNHKENTLPVFYNNIKLASRLKNWSDANVTINLDPIGCDQHILIENIEFAHNTDYIEGSFRHPSGYEVGIWFDCDSSGDKDKLSVGMSVYNPLDENERVDIFNMTTLTDITFCHTAFDLNDLTKYIDRSVFRYTSLDIVNGLIAAKQIHADLFEPITIGE
jgi:hypothetical protein